MQQRVITIVLLIGLGFGLVTLGSGMAAWRLPDNERGYAPQQPIDYSHRLHAGELGIDCQFCHTGAGQSRHAGIPSSDVCMKCHKFVTSSFAVLQDESKQADAEKRKPQPIISAELRKLYDSLGLDQQLNRRPDVQPQSIPWVRVHNLPDHVYFDHRAHVVVGVTCQRCHGPVESMERVRQFETLSMGWCVNCHRETTAQGIDGKPVNAGTSCAVCHY
ncbi:hypothetical protein FJ250_13835 [bacterium]|nr:hypothetical protein [Planctomycetota bacterium]MBM4132081.1 hypothetical protein [bacterium]